MKTDRRNLSEAVVMLSAAGLVVVAMGSAVYRALLTEVPREPATQVLRRESKPRAPGSPVALPASEPCPLVAQGEKTRPSLHVTASVRTTDAMPQTLEQAAASPARFVPGDDQFPWGASRLPSVRVGGER